MSLLVVLFLAFLAVYASRIQTISTIQKITSYEDGYNLYRMNVEYDYNMEHMLSYGITDTQSFVDAIMKEALPFLPVHMEVPDFGCSVLNVEDTAGDWLMGRNYDFKNNTSCVPGWDE